MIISGVLALVAIGLGIWAFTTKSDLDDANDQLDAQKQAQTSEQQAAQSQQERLTAFGDRERAAFQRVKRRFIREEAQAGNLKTTIQKESSDLDAARNQASAAEGEDQKAAAELNTARQQAELASVCVQGAVNALDKFFNAASAKAGANAAVAELESIQKQCNKADQQ
jgi:hypothetical protein